MALTSVVGASLSLPGCNSAEATATATPASHEKTIEAIQNNPNMPAAAKQQAIDRMKAADKEAGFMPTKK
jgi:hypothetical protein